MFLHAVDTGLQDEAIQTRLRPFFQKPDVQDEVLIQQINEIVLEETERKWKLGSSTRHKNPKVNEVQVSQTGEGAVQPATMDNKLKRTEAGYTKEDNFMAALQAVHSELATLKESIEKNWTKDERLTITPPGSQNQQWQKVEEKQKVEGSRVTIVISVVVVIIALAVVRRRIAVAIKQVRETGIGYNHGTGSSPLSWKL